MNKIFYFLGIACNKYTGIWEVPAWSATFDVGYYWSGIVFFIHLSIIYHVSYVFSPSIHITIHKLT